MKNLKFDSDLVEDGQSDSTIKDGKEVKASERVAYSIEFLDITKEAAIEVKVKSPKVSKGKATFSGEGGI